MLQPGRPNSTPHAVTTAEWERNRLIAYISGTALIVLSSPTTLLQTLYHDAPLTAVTLDATTGAIAVSSANTAHIYHPDNRGEGFLTWVLHTTITLPPADGAITSLSWSPTAELLIGSSSLTLWSTASTTPTPHPLWRRPLANPCRAAALSPDGTLAASIGPADRLVKVWRRVSIGSESLQFDYTYLPHPRAVSALHWRRCARGGGGADENVLYTVGVDGVLRVWAPVWPHDVGVLQLWAVVDLTCGAAGAAARFVLVLDSGCVAVAAEAAVASAGEAEKDMEVLQRLIEVARRGPEIVLAVDARGRMSAWGVENVGCRTRKTTNVFSILEGAEGSGLEPFLQKEGEEGAFVCFQAWPGGKGLNVLAHVFDGRLCWFEARLDRLLDLSPRGKRMDVLGVLSGHSTPIETLVRTADGKAMITLTRDNEHIVWTQPRGDHFTLNRQSSLKPDMHVHRAVVLDDGKLVMTMHHECVVLWNTRQQRAKEIARLPYSSKGKMLCLLLLPEAKDTREKLHVVGLTSEMKGIAWEISTTASPPSLREFATFELDHDEDLLMILPVDPVGWNATLSPSSTLDTFSREVATTVNASGLLKSFTAKLSPTDTPPTLRWLPTSTVPTGIANPALAKGNSIRKIALVNAARSTLTIWDSRAAQLEHSQDFATGDAIRDLDWTSTPDSQGILAVGFPHRVLLLCQLRYDYLAHGPSWAAFREIRTRDLTPHPIGDSLWLANGGLVIGAGNQLFVHSRRIEETDGMGLALPAHHKGRLDDDVFEIVSVLNGPVPVYHPQFLQQCILAGKSALVEEILVALHRALRTWHEEIPLDNLLDIPIERFLIPDDDTSGGGGGGGGGARNRAAAGGFFDYLAEEEFSSFDEALAASLCALLVKIPIPALTGSEQIMLAGTIECVGQVRQHRRSIDENAARYLLFYRQGALQRKKEAAAVSYREVVWAFHSESQEILSDIVNRGSMTWAAARECGIFLWLRDEAAVRRQMEVVARNAYNSTDERNPVHCSLYYLALRKKAVLVGLWRMAAWNREQAGTMKLLASDFREERWRTAAKKNAYALLGKRRFEYAAAFFLLADSLKDAVNICLDKLDDPQLAIAIARVYDGDASPVLHSLLEHRILPLAAEHGNRWLASWAFWMLRKKDLAVQSLLMPLCSLLPTPAATPASQLFTSDDPALVILYHQIREKTVQTLRGAARISPADESAFVLHTARLYDRMGCDLLALELVRNWRFLPAGGDRVGVLGGAKVGGAGERVKMGRRRGSVTVVDMDVPGMGGMGGVGAMGMGMGGVGGAGVRPPVAVFQEPDMSWAF
ncbi:uncharacterized protein H6S33_004304 [Morchella sextelata]|uniref:uncharacterized protein n=1 Tax=Morchella sextelata TaxID=1174677 RepID=UPI001D03F84A|nr:uncharacterized protein H6S33_004304 [Morchella sextelata]KAH0605847.1 hypothetical protein H6S33_004304 [Morchella sextelata]